MSDATIWREIKERLNGRAPEFVRWLFPQAVKCSMHELGVGSLEGAPGDSLKIVVDGAKVGVWRDFSGSDGGNNLFDLMLKVRGLAPVEGLKVAADWLGYVLPERPAKPKGKRPSRFVCAYDYTTAAGVLVHQTVRFHYVDAEGKDLIDAKTGSAEKTFFQRRPAREGMKEGSSVAKRDREGKWWLWTLAGIEPVLYKLPLIAGRPQEEVWLCEGEKDAEALVRVGFVATTCPMGAGKWRDSYTSALKGRRVVLCGDSDPAGVAGMEAIGARLQDAGIVVEQMDWLAVVGGKVTQEKWDAAKFLNAENL